MCFPTTWNSNPLVLLLAVNFCLPLCLPLCLFRCCRCSGYIVSVYFITLCSQGNWVYKTDAQLKEQKPEYDIVLLLSTTKWIHLNWGDEGLKRAFKRIFCALKPGGMFIMEPQECKSYLKKKKLTVGSFNFLLCFVFSWNFLYSLRSSKISKQYSCFQISSQTSWCQKLASPAVKNCNWQVLIIRVSRDPYCCIQNQMNRQVLYQWGHRMCLHSVHYIDSS